MNSILNDIKKILCISDDVTSFDEDIILIINAVLNTVTDLGVGPQTGYIITDAQNTWDELLNDDVLLEKVKLYVGLKTRLLFDPPANNSMQKVIEEELQELEWRISSMSYKKNEE